MEVKFTKNFFKQIKQLDSSILIDAITSVIKEIESSDSIEQVKSIKKIKGYPNHFRVRIKKDYRLGIIVQYNIAILAVFKHRKDIYKKLPWPLGSLNTDQ